MGESRGGEGRSRQATTSDIASYIARTFSDDGRVPVRISVQQATPFLYPVRVWYEGESDPEAALFTLQDGE